MSTAWLVVPAPMLAVVAALLPLWAMCMATSCGARDTSIPMAPAPSPAPSQPTAATPWQQIVRPFEPPAPYKPYFGDQQIAPPDLDNETWRVLVNQTEPMQRTTPRWQALPARQTVELQMPSESKFRCVVPPVRVTPEGDDNGAGIEVWHLKRSVLCSSDAFRTWNETFVHVRLRPDGARKVLGDGGALLREHAKDGSVSEMFVLMRTDKEQTHATLGPPKIIADGVVEPD